MSLLGIVLYQTNGSFLFLFVIVIFHIEPVLSGFACLKNPCQHGICIDDIDSPHNCYCRNGFTGYSCEINWDECMISPCLNGGTCVDGIASFNCTCPESFVGTYCEYDLSNCECLNNGTCKFRPEEFSNKTDFYCSCPLGFTGDKCEEDVSICNTTQNICLNGGKCIDGIGHRFYCECVQGWSGETCELEIDECSSQPCQNGGVCIDLVNDYSCACPFGYTGRSCETKLKICIENPCKNDGFCLEEDGDPICYCVPDFHGILCEEQYNECELGPKCFNNGTCIDGVGEFTCSCPPDFFGPTCQCTAENRTEPECQMPNATMTTTFPPLDTTVMTTVTSAIDPSPTIIDQTEGVIMTMIPSPSITDEPEQTTFSLDEPTVTMSFFPSTSLITGTEELTISTPFPSDELTVTLLPSTEDVLLMPTPTMTFEPASTDYTEMATPLPPSSPSASEVEMTVSPSLSLSFPDQMSSFGNWTVSDFPTPSETLIQPEPIPSNTMTITPVVSDSLGLFTPSSYPSDTIEPSSTITDSYETVLYPITSESPIIPEVNETETTTSSSQHPISLQPTGSTPNVSSQVTTPEETNFTATTPQEFITITSDVPGMITDKPGLRSTSSGDPELPTTTTAFSPSISPEITTKETPTTTPTAEVTSSEPLLPTTITFTPQTPSPEPITSTEGTNLTNPCDNYCQNNAKCIFTTIETICICPFKYTGKQCEKVEEKVISPSFTGSSYLKYELPKETKSVVDINVEMATVAQDGILLYTNSFIHNHNKSDIDIDILNTVQQNISYGLIFIQNGHITLHFSCGSQSMQFIETRTKVNNGYNFTLQFSLDMSVDGTNLHDIYCIGKLSVNNSYVMTGQQLVGKSSLPIFEYIYIGGVDSSSRQGKSGTNFNDMVSFIPGLRGCIYGLMISKESRDLYDDAMDGKGIQECETLSCSVNPCFGNSKCVLQPKPPFWQCICPDGYVGPTCKIRVCKENPCKNGATCTHSPLIGATTTKTSPETSSLLSSIYSTSSNTTCLCPIGFSGQLCQSRITMSKPSFHPTKPYASYMSYFGIPRLDEWFQLKFHFVTYNFDQIALMLYVGNSNAGIRKALLSNTSTLMDENLFEHENDYEQQIEPSIPDLYETSTEPHNSDFFAISFLRGYVGITWNLGSGTQRILTPSRIDPRINVHTLYVGRAGRQSWIKLDGMKNISGRTRGPLYRLNVDTDLYVGGHEAYGFDGLPHDLSLHSGFQGCIFDLGFRVKNKLFIPRSFKGRNVKNCFEDC